MTAALTLPDAIRIGATKRPQGFGFFGVRDSEGNISSCAIGAAYEALSGCVPPVESGIEDSNGAWYVNAHSCCDIFPAVYGAIDLRRLHIREADAIIGKIYRLNDTERLSREEIANIVEAEIMDLLAAQEMIGEAARERELVAA